MKFNPDIHHRRSVRLRGYDYSQEGLYFVTICTQNRECLFGEIISGQMRLNPMGEIAQAEWIKTEQMRPNIQLHDSIVMPNHIHGIIQITHPTPVGARCTRPPHASTTPATQPIANIRPTDGNAIAHHTGADTDMGVADRDAIADHTGLGRVQRAPTIGDVVRGYKSSVTRRINEIRNMSGVPVWQRNYHEHIIRTETAYLNIAEYIQDNPTRWQNDTYHP
jgi:putative transposase